MHLNSAAVSNWLGIWRGFESLFFFFWNVNFSGSTKGIGFLEQIATAAAISFYMA